MKNLTVLLFLFVCMLTGASCNKYYIREIEVSEKRILGTWQVNEIITRQTDTLNNTISEITQTNQGTIEFTPNDDAASGSAFFRSARFEGDCVKSALVEYFSYKDAGYETPTKGWILAFDPDPQDLRIQFWGISDYGGSFHQVVTLNPEATDKNRMEWQYTTSDGSNSRVFYTFRLSK